MADLAGSLFEHLCEGRIVAELWKVTEKPRNKGEQCLLDVRTGWMAMFAENSEADSAYAHHASPHGKVRAIPRRTPSGQLQGQ
jgi:hypothetical protein